MSASPFVMGKFAQRVALVRTQALRHRRPVIYVNQVGGNDELVFDGASFAMNAAGEIVGQLKAFEEDLAVVDLPGGGRDEEGDAAGQRPTAHAIRPTAHAIATTAQAISSTAQAGAALASLPDDIESARLALVLGLRDYMRKCGFKSAVLGLSGGIDSSLVACLAVEAIGRENVAGIAMPSRYSSTHSVEDARALAANLGIRFVIIPIDGPHRAFEAALAEVFSTRRPDITEENIQARVRGTILMALSNKFGHLVLSTGNKSEVGVGYCTLYGDMCGGLSVISDIPKTLVYKICRRINEIHGAVPPIPERVFTKPPSAELRPDQTDQDSLPPYDILDAILDLYVRQERSADDIVAAGFDAATVAHVIRLVDHNEYKRKQAAPGLKVTSRAFGVGRRMPIAQRYEPT